MFYANLSILLVGAVETKTILNLFEDPIPVLAPLILMLATTGAYISRGLVLDVMIAQFLVCGIIGYFLRRTGIFNSSDRFGAYSREDRRTKLCPGMQMVHYDIGTYFSRPICSLLIIAGAITFLSTVYRAFTSAKTAQ